MVEKEYEMTERIDRDEIKDMYEQSYPKIINQPFKKKSKGFLGFLKFWKKTEKEFIPNVKEYLLQLITETGKVEWLEGVKPGLFKMRDKKSGKEKGIILQQKKVLTHNFPPFPRGFIAHENEMTPYPLDIYHDSEELVGIIRRIQSDRNVLKDQAKIIHAKMLFWLAIIGVSLFGVYHAFSQGWIKLPFG